MNRYKLTHITTFEYDGAVSDSRNEVRLRPLDDELQRCPAFRISIDPAAPVLASRDLFGNWVHSFEVSVPHRRLRIETESIVRVLLRPEPESRGALLQRLPAYEDALWDEFAACLRPTEYVPHLADLRPLVDSAARASDGTALGFVESAAGLIHRDFRYQKGVTQASSSIRDALGQRAGVCQDFAHLLLALARMRGLPGRYVSGYLVPRRTAEPGASIEEVIGGQSTHAWVEIFVPDVGWVPQDPTLGRPVGIQHVRVAYGRDYGDVTPVRGHYCSPVEGGPVGQKLTVDVRVRAALDTEMLDYPATDGDGLLVSQRDQGIDARGPQRRYPTGE